MRLTVMEFKKEKKTCRELQCADEMPREVPVVRTVCTNTSRQTPTSQRLPCPHEGVAAFISVIFVSHPSSYTASSRSSGACFANKQPDGSSERHMREHTCTLWRRAHAAQR